MQKSSPLRWSCSGFLRLTTRVKVEQIAFPPFFLHSRESNPHVISTLEVPSMGLMTLKQSFHCSLRPPSKLYDYSQIFMSIFFLFTPTYSFLITKMCDFSASFKVCDLYVRMTISCVYKRKKLFFLSFLYHSESQFWLHKSFLVFLFLPMIKTKY